MPTMILSQAQLPLTESEGVINYCNTTMILNKVQIPLVQNNLPTVAQCISLMTIVLILPFRHSIMPPDSLNVWL